MGKEKKENWLKHNAKINYFSKILILHFLFLNFLFRGCCFLLSFLFNFDSFLGSDFIFLALLKLNFCKCRLKHLEKRLIFCRTSVIFNFQLRQYIVIGRKLPTENEPNPKLYKMQIFASNHVVAKSRFWYFTSMLRRVKKTNGEIVSCQEVCVFICLGVSIHQFADVSCSQTQGHRVGHLGWQGVNGQDKLDIGVRANWVDLLYFIIRSLTFIFMVTRFF